MTAVPAKTEIVGPPAAPAFNYDSVAEDYQGTLMAAADRIKTRVRRQTADIIEIGHDLLAINAELDHGLFLKWIAAEFRWSARTAQNYMAAAEWAGTKCETVSHLPPTLVYALANKRTPDAIKTEVRADLDAGKPLDVKAIRDRIKRAKAPKPSPEASAKLAEPASQQQQESEQDPDQVDAERTAAAVEIVALLRKLSDPDFERLMHLLKTASLWLVQDMLDKGRA
jgi:hypothetical protein